MLLILSFFCSNSLPTINLEEITDNFFSEHPITITETGKILAFSKSHMYLWGRNGELILTWAPPQGSIWSALEFQERYLVSYATNDGQGGTALLDSSGAVLMVGDFFAHNLQEFAGIVYGLPVTPEVLLKRKYPPLIVEILLGDSRLGYKKSGPILMNSKLTDLKMNFKKSWMLPHNENVLLMNEVETKIYQIRAEDFSNVAEVFNLPPTIPSLILDLDGFEPVKELFLPPQGIHRYEEVKDLMAAWWHSFSTIKGFDAYDNGFLIAYTVPVCNNDSCFASHLKLQRFTDKFETLGAPFNLMNGYYAGVWQNHVQIVEANPRTENDRVVLRPILRSIDLGKEK